jgi:hypothetical protein
MAKIGAIRFDWDYATAGSNASVNSLDGEIGILSPSAYHGLLPFHGAVTGTNSVSVAQGDQSRMDREIEMAWRCGVDYFAFDFYPTAAGYPLNGSEGLWTGVNDGLKYYLSSSKNNLVKFCLILVCGSRATPNPLTTGNWGPIADQIVTYMGNARHEIAHATAVGLANRPILYMFDVASFIAQGGTAAMITTLRNKATAAGLQNPYIGTMAGASTTEATTLGLDFLSNYALNLGGSGSAISVGTYDAAHTTLWNSQSANGPGYGVVPNVNAGWDIRPRVANGFWCAQLAAECTDMDYTTRATPTQLAARIKAASDFVAAHPSICNSEHVLIGAWNELSEDGNALLPHANDGGMNLQAMAQVLGRQREAKGALRARGLQIVSR